MPVARISSLLGHFSRQLSLVFIAGLIIASCTDDDSEPPGAIAPENPSQPTAETDTTATWTQIELEESQEPPLPGTCEDGSVFRIEEDGDFSYQDCDTNRTGTVSDAELSELDRRINLVIQNGITIDAICLELAYPGIIRLTLTLANNQAHSIHQVGMDGSCFLADVQATNNLELLVRHFRSIYALSTGTPTPTPLVTPPVVSTPPVFITPPVVGTTPIPQTSPVFATPPTFATPPVFVTPPVTATPPTFTTPPVTATPPTFTTPPVTATPPTFATPPVFSRATMKSRSQSYPGGVSGALRDGP